VWLVSRVNGRCTKGSSTFLFQMLRSLFFIFLLQMSMYVFGGSLYPSEIFTSDLWQLDLDMWEWQPLFSLTTPMSHLTPPVPVRDHTAHVVGSKMVVLYGLSFSASGFFPLIQEYDFSKCSCFYPTAAQEHTCGPTITWLSTMHCVQFQGTGWCHSHREPRQGSQVVQDTPACTVKPKVSYTSMVGVAQEV